MILYNGDIANHSLRFTAQEVKTLNAMLGHWDRKGA